MQKSSAGSRWRRSTTPRHVTVKSNRPLRSGPSASRTSSMTTTSSGSAMMPWAARNENPNQEEEMEQTTEELNYNEVAEVMGNYLPKYIYQNYKLDTYTVKIHAIERYGTDLIF